MVLPILMLGSIAVVLKEIPIHTYQRFIGKAFDGAFLKMFSFMYDATFGMLSVYMVMSITNCYMSSRGAGRNYVFVGGLTSVASFFVLAGVNMENINDGTLGTKGMFTAIFTAVIVSRLFILITKNVKIPFRLYADGVDLEFNDAVLTMIPLVSITILFAILNYLVCQVFQTDSFQNFYVHIVNGIFKGRESSFINGFMYIVISGILWFFGIYGSDVLDTTFDKMFRPELADPSVAAEGTRQASQILTQEFFQVFVVLGGTGVAFGLLISILIFSKRKISKNLMKISVIPMAFNFSDILAFGYPVIFNPYMLAPFLVVPAVAYCVAYLAFYYGFVPMITKPVDATMPVLLSGYISTGSIFGVLLQLLILLISVFIYLPFVKLYDWSKSRNEKERMRELTGILKKAEEEKEEVELLRLPGTPGALAKCLAADIKAAIEDEQVELNYQLQYDNDYNCIGAETLMRYKHPIHGYIYPPLVVKIADEAKLLSKLERFLFVQAGRDYRKVKDVTNRPYKISVNVTIATILEKDFISFLRKLKSDYQIEDGEMCIEITEQMAIKSDKDFENALNEVKKLGYMIAIDDFSMGSTSIKYLQKNQFDMVKLDGSIVKEMMNNERSRDIISSIVYLAHSLNFSVLAEYVETEEQIEELKKVGCNYYQGYHFSKAVGINEFLTELKEEKEGRNKFRKD